MGKKIKRPRIQVLENHRYGDWYDETSQGTVVRHNKLMWLAHCLVWFKRTLKRGLIISRGWHWTLLLYPEQEGKKDQTPWKTQKEWRKATCKYAGGTWKDCQGCFLQGFFTAIIVWQEEITFAMRRLGLGLCLNKQAVEMLLLLSQWLQRRTEKLCLCLCCKAWAQTSAFFVDTVYIYQTNKNVLVMCGHDRHLLALGLPREFLSSVHTPALHHFLGKVIELPLAL